MCLFQSILIMGIFFHSNIFRVCLSVLCPHFPSLSFSFFLLSVCSEDGSRNTNRLSLPCGLCPSAFSFWPFSSSNLHFSLSLACTVCHAVFFSFCWPLSVFLRFLTIFYYANLFSRPLRPLPLKPQEPGSQSLKYHYWSQVANRQNCSTTSSKMSPTLVFLNSADALFHYCSNRRSYLEVNEALHL